MNNAKLYNKSNVLQKRDAQDVIKEFAHVFENTSDEADQTLLDIGCGAGDVLAEIIMPRLTNKFIKVIGVDISKEMIKYASEKYRSKFLRFLKVDIESEFLSMKGLKITQANAGQQQHQLQPESFNFITSFYCLHWIQNQRQAISNIYKLLKPNGTCLLAFLVSNPIFDVYLDLSHKSKYSKYMADVDRFISPYHFEEKPLEVFSQRLYEVGFKILHIEIRDQIFVFDDTDVLKYSVKAVNPFTGRMPENLQQDFLNDYVKKVEELNFIEYNERTAKQNVLSPYKLMVVVANK